MIYSLPVGTVLSAEVSDVALPSNYGVVRDSGFVIFVPYGLPGDKVKLKVTGFRKKYAFADIIELTTPSPDRVTPFCSHFGSCGGCSLQHLQYAKQLDLKKEHITQALRRLGGIDEASVPIREPIPSPDSRYYRGKLELTFGTKGNKTILGLRPRTYAETKRPVSLVALQECPVFSSQAASIISHIQELATKSRIHVYAPQHKQGLLKHLIIRESKSTHEIMVIIEISEGMERHIRPFWEAIADALPSLTSIYVAVAAGPSDYRYFRNVTHVFGKKSLNETIDGLTFEIYPQSFFQPNPRAATGLYRALLLEAQLTGKESILGLYSGIGCIELYLSLHTASVDGVDSLEQNVQGARRNVTLNNVLNCTFHSGRAETILEKFRGTSRDRIVVDPPRSGIPQKTIDEICLIGAPMIIYVSCNPATLVRDAAIFRTKGYSIKQLIPFDFFPHTGHVESLACLVKDR
jgi:23S rRNA (uracil1939-C5)-methyltransferase